MCGLGIHSKVAAKLAALALPLLLGSAGCNTFKYFDIHVTFDPTAFDDASVGQIHHCRVLVTGADSSDFIIGNCPHMDPVNPLDSGTFEYSSFASSGIMKFELDTYVGLIDKPDCQSGKGTAAIPVTGLTTIMGDLVVNMKVGPQPACMYNETPPSDGGP